jgi:hypothetical protein
MLLSLIATTLALSWPDAVAAGVACEKGDASRCSALLHEARASHAATDCAQGQCLSFASTLAWKGATLEIRNLGLAHLLDSCRGGDAPSCREVDDWAQSLNESGGDSRFEVTAPSLRANADLLRAAGTLRSASCKNSQRDDRRCLAISRFPKWARRVDDAAENLAHGKPVCDRAAHCALACASGIAPACDLWKVPQGRFGGELGFAFAAGAWSSLQGCIAGNPQSCVEWISLLAEPRKDPAGWAELKPDAIRSVEATCDADLKCVESVEWLQGANLEKTEEQELFTHLEKSCVSGASTESCAASGQRDRAQTLRAQRFTAEPESLRGVRALGRWLAAAPATDAELKARDAAIFKALRWCATNAPDACQDAIDNPAVRTRFGDRLHLGEE